jgi:predicted transcriptional regulator
LRKQRRSRAEIVLEILEVLSSYEGISPTRLATAANLPYDRLQPILRMLVERGLVAMSRNSRSTVLSLTPKGFKVLRELRRVMRILLDFGLDLF